VRGDIPEGHIDQINSFYSISIISYPTDRSTEVKRECRRSRGCRDQEVGRGEEEEVEI